MPTGAVPAPESAAAGAPVSEVTRGRFSRTLEWLALAALAIVLFAFTFEGAPESPFFDDWAWIIQARAFDEGGFAGFLETRPLLHFQHFYLLPSLFAVLFGPLVDYSFRAFAMVCAALVFALGLTFWRLAKREGLGPLAALLVFFCVVSVRHHENLWVGFQLGLPACVLLGSLAVIVADARRDRSGLVLASVLAVLSAASSAAGVMACATVILVRGYAPRLQRLWIVAVIAGLFVVLHFSLVALHQPSFVSAFLAYVSWSKVPVFLQSTFRHVGAGLISGPLAVPVGVLLIAGALVLVVTHVGRTKRVDALVGLIVFSLSTCFLVAVSRPPVENPGSRHAIFAAPLVGVCAIAGLQWLQRTASVRAVGYVIVLVGLALCTRVNLAEADFFRRGLRLIVLNSEFAIALAAQGETLTPAETRFLYVGKPHEDVRAAVQFVVDRKLCGNHWQTLNLEHHEELPSLIHNAANVRGEAGLLRFEGIGHVYNEYPCSGSTGRILRLSAELSALGKATLGIIVLRPDGSERTNYRVHVRSGGEFATSVVRSRAGPGDRIQPYVYGIEPDQEITIKSFHFVMVDAPFDLERR